MRWATGSGTQLLKARLDKPRILTVMRFAVMRRTNASDVFYAVLSSFTQRNDVMDFDKTSAEFRFEEGDFTAINLAPVPGSDPCIRRNCGITGMACYYYLRGFFISIFWRLRNYSLEFIKALVLQRCDLSLKLIACTFIELTFDISRLPDCGADYFGIHMESPQIE